jgi:hypothetical protein
VTGVQALLLAWLSLSFSCPSGTAPALCLPCWTLAVALCLLSHNELCCVAYTLDNIIFRKFSFSARSRFTASLSCRFSCSSATKCRGMISYFSPPTIPTNSYAHHRPIPPWTARTGRRDITRGRTYSRLGRGPGGVTDLHAARPTRGAHHCCEVPRKDDTTATFSLRLQKAKWAENQVRLALSCIVQWGRNSQKRPQGAMRRCAACCSAGRRAARPAASLPAGGHEESTSGSPVSLASRTGPT